jgi:predicted ATPase
MLHTLAVSHYRTLYDLTMPLEGLNLISGANGCGKSNLYRALRLLAETAQGGVIGSLAREGGLSSTFWAGPSNVSRRMRAGEVPVQGTQSENKSKRLQLGFAGADFGYAISLGLPLFGTLGPSAFNLDPIIKHECIWATGSDGKAFRPARALVIRDGAAVKIREGRGWNVSDVRLPTYDSLFAAVADPQAAPEVFAVREILRGWRFYDHFRTDYLAPARQAQVGTRTPVLSHDGSDLSAALQTIIEVGDEGLLAKAVADAFPGAHVAVDVSEDGRFHLKFKQAGLLRPLGAAELSDGTLRYLLWIAALLSPRPPNLMVLNEPETSLHPDLLAPLARLICAAARITQVWVISHAPALIAALKAERGCNCIGLYKDGGQTLIEGQTQLERPSWIWPE